MQLIIPHESCLHSIMVNIGTVPFFLVHIRSDQIKIKKKKKKMVAFGVETRTRFFVYFCNRQSASVHTFWLSFFHPFLLILPSHPLIPDARCRQCLDSAGGTHKHCRQPHHKRSPQHPQLVPETNQTQRRDKDPSIHYFQFRLHRAGMGNASAQRCCFLRNARMVRRCSQVV